MSDPFILKNMETEIIVIDDTIKNETVSSLSKSVGDILIAHEYPTEVANRATLFIEEIALTILEKNKN